MSASGRFVRAALLIALCVLASGRIAAASGASPAKAAVTWISDSSGFWDDGLNWSTGIAPQAGDDVVIDRASAAVTVTVRFPTAAIATLTSAEFLIVNATLTVNTSAAINGGLRLSGVLGGNGAFTMDSNGEWWSGTISLAGGFTVAGGRTFLLTTGGGKVLSNSSLTNQGTVNWTSGGLTLDGTSSLTNAASGLIDAQFDLTIGLNNNGVETFANAGTLRKSAGIGAFQINTPFTNSGTIQVQSGIFNCTPVSGWTTSGLLNVSLGATLNLNGATLQAGTTLAGSGTLSMTATTTLMTNLTVTLPASLAGVLTGPGTWTMGAPLTWSAGTISTGGGIVVPPGQVLLLTTGGGKVLSNSTLTNHGTVTWTLGGLTLDGSSAVTNTATGLFDAQLDLAVGGNNNGVETFANAGILRKSAGAGGLNIGVSFNNTGQIQLQAGSFLASAASGWTTSGQLNLSPGTTMSLNAATLQAGSTFAGSGTLTMAGTTTLAVNLTIPLPITLTGILTGPGRLTVAGPFTWSAGTISTSGGILVPAGQALSLATGGGKVLSNSTMQNFGTVLWSFGGFTLDGSSSVTNVAGAIWDAQFDLTVGGNSNGVETFTNAGIVRKSAGAGQLTMGVRFVNSGILHVQAGSFLCSAPTGWTTSGQLNLDGGTTMSLNGATLQAGSTFAGSGALTMAGTTTLSTNLTIPLPLTLTGVLTGSGTLTIGAPLTWSSGTINTTGGLVVPPGQSLLLTTGGGKVLSNTTLINDGTVTWSSGGFTLDGSSSVTNGASGLWIAQFDLTLGGNNNGVELFTNAGTLRKSGGPNIFTMGVPFNNTGIIQVQTGSFFGPAGAGWTTSGQLALSPGTTMSLNGATLQAGSTFSGTGTLTMPGTTTLATNLTVPLPITLSSVLTGSGTLTVGAPFTWSAGTINTAGGIVVPPGQALSMTTPGGKVLANTTLVNHGAVSWSGGGVTLDGSSSVTNAADGTWEVQNILTMGGNNNGVEIFTNAGILRKTGTLGAFTMVALPFVNTGTIEIRLGGVSAGTFDTVVVSGSVTLGGTLKVSLAGGFTPSFRDAFAVLPYSSRLGQFTGIDSGAQTFVAAYGASALTLKYSVAPPLTELVRNGLFSSGQAFWATFATPDPSYIVASVVAGVMQFYRVPPPAGTSNQAIVFQETEATIAAETPLRASFDLWNTSSVRKRISVLIIDSNFSDLSVCTFWLAANSPARTYQMRTHTTQAWANAAIYFYAATAGSDGGAYQVDNVSMQIDPGVAADRADCVDPTAPAPGGVNGPNLLVNGDFATGQIAPWGLFGQITQQIAGGVFEFYRPATTPAGVILQITGQSMTAGQIMTATFQLGNSSAVRKRVTVLIHDSTFSDLSACTFWLAPGQPLDNYAVRMFATQAWASATLSVYPATIDSQPWIRLDNATLSRTPAQALAGTECIEPGTSAAWYAAAVIPALPVGTGSAKALGLAPDGEARDTGWIAHGFGLSADESSPVGAAWIARASKTGAQTLELADPFDVTGENALLAFFSWFSGFSGSSSGARVEVSADGVGWDVVYLPPRTDAWTPVTIDLKNVFPGASALRVRFVFDGVAPADGGPPDVWRLAFPLRR